MQAVSRIIILLMDIKNKSSAKQNSRAERGRFCDEFLLRASAHSARRAFILQNSNGIFCKIKKIRPEQNVQDGILPWYHPNYRSPVAAVTQISLMLFIAQLRRTYSPESVSRFQIAAGEVLLAPIHSAEFSLSPAHWER